MVFGSSENDLYILLPVCKAFMTYLSMKILSATCRDKGTEVPSLSRDKGTTGQAQNLATGRDGPG
jgi:hypothetical protein